MLGVGMPSDDASASMTRRVWCGLGQVAVSLAAGQARQE